MNFSYIARREFRSVDCVITRDRVFIEFAYPIMLKLHAEIFKRFRLRAYPGEKFYKP